VTETVYNISGGDWDDEIAERMDAGRRALMERGDDEAGPYQSPMEDGMQHFHAWYRREMAKMANSGSVLGSVAQGCDAGGPSRPVVSRRPFGLVVNV